MGAGVPHIELVEFNVLTHTARLLGRPDQSPTCQWTAEDPTEQVKLRRGGTDREGRGREE